MRIACRQSAMFKRNCNRLYQSNLWIPTRRTVVKSQRKGLVCRFLWKTGDLPLHLLQTRWGKFVRDSIHRTQLKTLIGHRVFQEWQKKRDDDQCPSDLLERPSAEKFNCWLFCFVVECRRVGGQPYPFSTLYQLLTGFSGYLSGPRNFQRKVWLWIHVCWFKQLSHQHFSSNRSY